MRVGGHGKMWRALCGCFYVVTPGRCELLDKRERFALSVVFWKIGSLSTWYVQYFPECSVKVLFSFSSLDTQPS